jgi:hypothetical protein
VEAEGLDDVDDVGEADAVEEMLAADDAEAEALAEADAEAVKDVDAVAEALGVPLVLDVADADAVADAADDAEADAVALAADDAEAEALALAADVDDGLLLTLIDMEARDDVLGVDEALPDGETDGTEVTLADAVGVCDGAGVRVVDGECEGGWHGRAQAACNEPAPVVAKSDSTQTPVTSGRLIQSKQSVSAQKKASSPGELATGCTTNDVSAPEERVHEPAATSTIERSVPAQPASSCAYAGRRGGGDGG